MVDWQYDSVYNRTYWSDTALGENESSRHGDAMPESPATLWAYYILLLIAFGVWFLYKPIPRTPPKATHIAGLIEASFAILFILLSIIVAAKNRDGYIVKFAVHLFGLGWLTMAIQLFKGNPKARLCCLILSILRGLTIVGFPLSIASVLLLYFNTSSRTYFQDGESEGR